MHTELLIHVLLMQAEYFKGEYFHTVFVYSFIKNLLLLSVEAGH